ncbi:MAG: hypothetical protein ACK4FZ_10570 [Vogesella sp.]|uniref:hypothetical protein n=1 Tax=Vogesella sp. TaxID=1904252 RepID=UPI0039191F88
MWLLAGNLHHFGAGVGVTGVLRLAASNSAAWHAANCLRLPENHFCHEIHKKHEKRNDRCCQMDVTKTVPLAAFPCSSCTFVAKKVLLPRKHTENTEGKNAIAARWA